MKTYFYFSPKTLTSPSYWRVKQRRLPSGNYLIDRLTETDIRITNIKKEENPLYEGSVRDLMREDKTTYTDFDEFWKECGDFFVNPLNLLEEAVEGLQQNKADLVDGKVPAEQLPSYVDDVINIEHFSDTEPVAQEDDLWYGTITDTLSVLQNGEWIDVEMDYGRIYVNVDQTSDSYNSTFRYNGVKLILLGANVTREFLEQMLVTRTLDLSAYNIDMSLADDFTKLTNGASSVFTISNPIIKKPFRLFISGGTLGTPLFTGYTATWKASTLQSDYNPAVVMVLCCEIRESGQITLFWEN